MSDAVTKIPRWRSGGAGMAGGMGSYSSTVPSDLVSRARARSEEYGCGLQDILTTAALAALATVTAEPEVSVGYRAAGDPAARVRSLRLDLGDMSWRVLAGRIADAVAAAVSEAQACDIVIDQSGLGDRRDAKLAGRTTLTMAFRQAAGRELGMDLHYRTEVVDASYLARFAGYVVQAIERSVALPDSSYREHPLLSDAELGYQLNQLSGPTRALPEEDFAELFETRVRRHPSAPAVSHGSRRWTYQELDENANRVANSLIARGLRAEDVVAVVTERGLPWAAAELGVFKAGGVYLPIRPQFPAARIRLQLERSRAAFVLTEDVPSASLAEALAALPGDIGWLRIDRVLAEQQDSTPPRVPLPPGQLAYIYFTSGSTGEPKGAMCEFGGMLNHLYAKVDDLDLGAGAVVAQTASQCFDISLWQLCAPLLVGGSVRIVDTDTQLDIGEFLAELRREGVAVAQLVPSYFEVLISEMERQPRDLGPLRVISVTGEALKFELVRRWFARYPQIRLINAYGATEVSDDTMHAVLDKVPDSGIIPVGRSLRNVYTYVLDERLRIVPLGSVGEIAFSGVCVGRGYVNDEDRTRQVFVSDPYRPDARLYRTGDFGRWLPDGTIEFLGRRDQQVKIRGYRVETGEIENRMLAMADVLQAAVVVDEGDGREKALVAFYAAPKTVTGEAMHRHLRGGLPDYLVPVYCHRLDSLPLTENGKIDKKTLTALARTLGHGGATYVGPRTSTEGMLATAWAEVLNVPLERIGTADGFFALGGTSLSALRLIVKLDRLVSLRDLLANPTLRALAEVIDRNESSAVDTSGDVDLLHRLSSAEIGMVGNLICFPYAGGNAVNFQPLAKELESDRVGVWAVELPGHDLSDGRGSFADVPEVAARVAAEIDRRITGPVMLWGQCAGAAHAVEVARLLRARSADLQGIFLGAAMLDDVEHLRAEVNELTGLNDHQITAALREDSVYVEFDGLKSERMRLVGSAYRHDVVSANRYLIGVRERPRAHRIDVPIDVIVAADDPSTTGYEHRYRAWELIGTVEPPYVLEEGGHYFVATMAAALASRVRSRWGAGTPVVPAR